VYLNGLLFVARVKTAVLETGSAHPHSDNHSPNPYNHGQLHQPTYQQGYRFMDDTPFQTIQTAVSRGAGSPAAALILRVFDALYPQNNTCTTQKLQPTLLSQRERCPMSRNPAENQRL
jgi:hypothetical protein